MKANINLWKKPKGVTIIEGFPGYGLVATIATGFLLDHLSCEKIGNFFFEEGPATLAIHQCLLIDPIGVYYNKKYNLVVVSPGPHILEALDLIEELGGMFDQTIIAGYTAKAAQLEGVKRAASAPADPSL